MTNGKPIPSTGWSTFLRESERRDARRDRLSRESSMAFIIGTSLLLWAVIFGAIALFF